ncbi:MAG TPA: transketolase [Verrucomicrobiae bacterium]|nr:transketolase [Verrucomicrobiae bacterium]
MPTQTKTVKTPSIEELKAKAKQIRRDIVHMTAVAGSGHPGGSLSATEILTALYFAVMKHDPKSPKWADRDRFILSKGHASPLLYSVLAEAGYFDRDLLPTFRKLNSPLQGHPDRRRLAGVEASTGSLGQGLSIGIGHALARRLDQKSFYTYVVVSDGESNEGQIWEAAAMAAHHKVDHLITFLDYNKFQLDDATHVICNMEPMGAKWASFGWNVQEIDGHDLGQILAAVEKAKQVKNQPAIIVCHTVKGKGISFMENNNHFHGVSPTKEEMEKALKELS